MLDSITFKTDISEILTLEEVAVLFDSIKKKSEFELISLSIFPKFNQLREGILLKATGQRNAELSKLLMKIAERKQEIKINIWKTLSTIGANKKTIQNNPARAEELEQIIYESEQIFSIYENSIKALEHKEKKIMNGKYPRVEKIRPLTRKKALSKQLAELRDRLNKINELHDNCFVEYLDELDELVGCSIISQKTKFPKNFTRAVMENYANSQSIKIASNFKIFSDEETTSENIEQLKDYYLYEPVKDNIDDDLIYQLLAQANYEAEDGTINELLINTELEEV